jgi:hypothetical protein
MNRVAAPCSVHRGIAFEVLFFVRPALAGSCIEGLSEDSAGHGLRVRETRRAWLRRGKE